MMISRALLIALFSAFTTSLTPLAPLATAGDDDCALYLTGPGRSSAYDYSLNLLKGNFAYDGQHTCITYEAINQAYLDARSRILVSQPKGDWHAEDFASVGELILDISINLARTYGLTYEEIEKGLPLIDTSRTLIREVCPPVFSHVECRAGKYRRFDGLCNNLQHPTWGATMAPFQRLIGPLFADGINAPRIAHTGRDLPLSRVVSRTMHPDDGFHDHAGTVMVIAWGQFMDHDYTLTGTPLDPINRNDPEECCKRPPHLKHPYCNEIRVPDDDYFYRLFGVKCIDFVRGFPSPRPGCKLGSRVPFNTLTGSIDGNTVYGVTEKFARKLRTGYGGLLRMNPVFKEYGLKDLLPLKLDIPDEGCTRPNKNMYCFEAGEIRVNEQLVLTVMHTLMAREHNRVAKGLAEVNPHWDDETLFQEARRINIAEIQHITYNEFLPILLGKDVMEKFGLVLEKEGYWNGYDAEVNPDVIDSFASAAYRFGHSLLPTAVERWSKAHKFIASKRLSDLIRRPYDLYRAGVLDEYVMGLMNQVAQAMDDSITQEVTNHLFKKVGARFGMDLVSFNMQRGREFGIPGYMEFRKFCGLSDAHTFQDLFGSMPNETLRKYETIFEHPIDIDLWSGGVSERPLRGSMLGPTFACIIATQFSYSRRGDRFWFELPKQPSSFTPEQLAEIRKSRLARVICDNTDIIDTVQLYPMVLPDHELNPRVPCRSGIIPSMDFSKWAELVPYAGAAKQYITEAVTVNNTLYNKQQNNITMSKNITELFTNITDNIIQVENSHKKKDRNVDKTYQTATEHISNDTNLKKEILDVIKFTKVKNKNNYDDVVAKKTSGHQKNMLRKRRSAPLVYNYVTNHGPEDNVNLKREGIVKSSNLADFNIRTLHEPLKNVYNEHDSLKNINNERAPLQIIYKEVDNSENDDIEKSNEYSNPSKNKKSAQEIDESSEIKNNSEPKEVTDSSEFDESPIDTRKKHFSKINERHSEEDSTPNEKGYNNKRSSYAELNKSGSNESDDSEVYEKPSFEGRTSNPKFGKIESRENEESGDEEYKSEINKKEPYSELNSFEINNSQEKYPDLENLNSHSVDEDKTSKEIQDNKLLKSKHLQSSQFNYQGTERSSDESENNSDSNESIQIVDELERNNYSKYNKNNPQSSQNSESNESFVDSKLLQVKANRNNNIDKESKERSKNEENQHNLSKDIPLNTLQNYNGTIGQQVVLDSHAHIIKEGSEESVEKLKEYVDYLTSPVTVNPVDKDSITNISNNNLHTPLPHNSSKLKSINDDEIKPVIELNNDDGSDESIEDSPLSTLGGNIKETLNQRENKRQENKKVDLKQDVERIPLDYKHSEDDTDTDIPKTKILENTSGEDDIEHDKLDENLNIKFGDVAVKLPEIKLPDDILDYNYEEPSYKKNKSNLKPYNEDEDESEKNIHDRNNNQFVYQDNFGDIFSKKKSPSSAEDEENDNNDEDLYEKFVRERFGKRRSTQTRNSKYIMPNKELYNTLKNVLRKTEKIQQEAEKSDDPNAGYAWTLEYGQKL